jgi:hypothetical protein
MGQTKADIKAEIEDLRTSILSLTEGVKLAKTALDTAKTAFNEEAKDPENSKAKGQPTRDS